MSMFHHSSALFPSAYFNQNFSSNIRDTSTCFHEEHAWSSNAQPSYQFPNNANHNPAPSQFPYNQIPQGYPLERSPIGQNSYLATQDCSRDIQYGGNSSPVSNQYSESTEIEHWSNINDIRRKQDHKPLTYR